LSVTTVSGTISPVPGSTRVDPSGTTTFGYDWAGRPTSTDSPLTTVTPHFAYRLDGLVGTRTWETTNALGTFTYDRAKRPMQLSIGGSGVASLTLTQTYDRAGNVRSEGRTFAGIEGRAGNSEQVFTYDGLYRVVMASINAQNTTYTYDRDSNRTSVTKGETTTTYTFDTTDQLYRKTADGISGYFSYDSYGNMTTSAESVAQGVGPTTYAYDLADRMIGLTAPSSSATIGIDALGRIKNRTTAATEETPETVAQYAFVGSSETVSRITTVVDETTTAVLDGVIGSDGSRLASSLTTGGPAFGLLVPDLHGSVAAAVDDDFSVITDAFRYDPYGESIGTAESTLPTPWRYQGRLLVSGKDDTDLYDSGARFYSPGLGVFTGFDTYAGSAANPITMNRYLYANANPATLIDPSGHCGLNPFDGSNCFSDGLGGLGNVGATVVKGAATVAAAPYDMVDSGVTYFAPGFQNTVVNNLGPLRGTWDAVSSPVALAEGTVVGFVDGARDVTNETVDGIQTSVGCANDAACRSSMSGSFNVDIPAALGSVRDTVSTVWNNYKAKIDAGDYHGAGKDQGHALVSVVQIVASVVGVPALAKAGLQILKSLAPNIRNLLPKLKILLSGGGRLPDSAVIVRGGTGEVPPPGHVWSGTTGSTVEEAAQGVPHGAIRTTTAGDIRASGGAVRLKPEFDPNVGQVNNQHVNFCVGTGRCPFGDLIDNPVPRQSRWGQRNYPYGWKIDW
jgi:RHS repeat-associated protein